jgi:hypothetical protein
VWLNTSIYIDIHLKLLFTAKGIYVINISRICGPKCIRSRADSGSRNTALETLCRSHRHEHEWHNCAVIKAGEELFVNVLNVGKEFREIKSIPEVLMHYRLSNRASSKTNDRTT